MPEEVAIEKEPHPHEVLVGKKVSVPINLIATLNVLSKVRGMWYFYFEFWRSAWSVVER